MPDYTVRVMGVPECLRGLEELDRFFKSPKAMEGLTEDVRKRILDLTAKSLDYRGRRFAPYSARYAKKKREKGGTGKVNLFLSGTMLHALTTAVINPKKGRVFVQGDPEPGGRITAEWLAEIHSQGTGPQKQREFMNITKSALKDFIKKRFDDPILDIVKKHLRHRTAGV